jgi:hypothetical protein
MRASWYKTIQSVSAVLLLILLIGQTFSGFAMTGRIAWIDPGQAYSLHIKSLLIPFLVITVVHVMTSIRLMFMHWRWMPRHWVIDMGFAVIGLALLGSIVSVV